jgi:hypothetical protein
LWLQEAGLEQITKDDRWALIGIGAHLELAKEVFGKYGSCWGWRGAWAEIKRLRSLRTRERQNEREREVATPEGGNVVALRQPPSPSIIDEPSLGDRSGSPPLSLQQESHMCALVGELIYAMQFWQDDPAPIISHWAHHRGDEVPTVDEIRALEKWLDAFASAIEQYQARKAARRKRRCDGSS